MLCGAKGPKLNRSSTKVLASSLIIIVSVVSVAVVYQYTFDTTYVSIEKVSQLLRSYQAETLDNNLAAIVKPAYTHTRMLAKHIELQFARDESTLRSLYSDDKLLPQLLKIMWPTVDKWNHMAEAGKTPMDSTFTDYIGQAVLITDTTAEEQSTGCRDDQFNNTWLVGLVQNPDDNFGPLLFDYQVPERPLRILRLFDPSTLTILQTIAEIPPLDCKSGMTPLWGPSARISPTWENATWNGPYNPQLGWGQHFEFGMPVYNSAGKTIGRITSAISFRSVSSLLERQLEEGGAITQGSSSAVYTEAGVVIGFAFPGNTERDKNMEYYTTDFNDTLKDGLALVLQRTGSICPSAETIFGHETYLISVRPFYAEKYGMQPLPNRWCLLTVIPRKNMFSALDTAKDWGVGMYCVVSVGCGLAVALVLHTVFTDRKTMKKQAALQLSMQKNRILKIVGQAKVFTFPMAIIRSDIFAAEGQLVVHSQSRDRGLLTWCDNPAEAMRRFIIFVSHQWLSWNNPDLDNVHFNSTVRSVNTLLTSRSTRPSEAFLWYDYVSVPQANGISAVQNAIDSLTLYVQSSSVLIVIAPEVKHGDTAELCNFESYMSRAWCRAEQASHLLTKGLSDMYVETGDGLKPVPQTSQKNALFVTDGEFTCCRRGHPGGTVCDRERLVDALLFLYMQLKCGLSPTKAEVLALVDNHIGTMFPAEYQYVTEGSKPQARTLFGNLVGVLDGMILSGEVAFQGCAAVPLPVLENDKPAVPLPVLDDDKLMPEETDSDTELSM